MLMKPSTSSGSGRDSEDQGDATSRSDRGPFPVTFLRNEECFGRRYIYNVSISYCRGEKHDRCPLQLSLQTSARYLYSRVEPVRLLLRHPNRGVVDHHLKRLPVVNCLERRSTFGFSHPRAASWCLSHHLPLDFAA
jgi:hypothetical protein